MAISAAGMLGSRAEAAESRPNVLLVMTDDQGYGDLGSHGNSFLTTPNLEGLIAESVEFNRFYCCPVCSPTRASLMTGRYHYRTGVIHTSRGGAKMFNDEVTVAELMQGAGYATGIFGKWHLGDNYPMRSIDQGFEESLVHSAGALSRAPDMPNSYFDPWLWHNGKKKKFQGYCTDVFTDAAIDFMAKSKEENKPFFVYLPTNIPHLPLEVAQKYSEPYVKQGVDEETAKIYGMLDNLDENIGRLLSSIDSLGIRENTVVIFLTDNGPQFKRFNSGLRGKKFDVYEGGIRVPCYIRWPEGISGSVEKIDQVAAHIDILPTIADICGVQLPGDLTVDGRSLLPLLKDQSPASLNERKLFIQCHRGLQPKRYQNAAIITSQYKLVGYPGTFIDEDLDISGEPVLELYDLNADREEKNDIAGKHPEVVAALLKDYEHWFDDMKNTRQFTPGVIHLGSPKDNPTNLCRYQDSSFIDGKPTGWPVFIERAGNYELTINRGDNLAAGDMCVALDGKKLSCPLKDGESSAVFNLPSGSAMLDIWVQETGEPRRLIVNNSILGDVQVRFLD